MTQTGCVRATQGIHRRNTDAPTTKVVVADPAQNRIQQWQAMERAAHPVQDREIQRPRWLVSMPVNEIDVALSACPGTVWTISGATVSLLVHFAPWHCAVAERFGVVDEKVLHVRLITRAQF